MDARWKFEENIRTYTPNDSSQFLNLTSNTEKFPFEVSFRTRERCLVTFYCDRMQNSHNAPKKVNKLPYWLVENTPHFILWFEREHLIQLTVNEKLKI